MILKYQAYMMRRIREMGERENMLRAALTNYLNDDNLMVVMGMILLRNKVSLNVHHGIILQAVN
jgi:hypothetical protein